jgi:hypothetical protein
VALLEKGINEVEGREIDCSLIGVPDKMIGDQRIESVFQENVL